jgi:hypothetical protein
MANTQKRQRPTSDDEFLRVIKRMVRSAGRRVGRGDPEELTELAEIRDLVDAQIHLSAEGLRDEGFTWASIGDALGITRQAAEQRFGR